MEMGDGDLRWIYGKVTALVLGAVCIGAVGNFGRHLGKKRMKGKR